MKTTTSKMMLCAALLGSFSLTASASPRPTGKRNEAPQWSRMHRAQEAGQWGNPANGGERQKRISTLFSTPASDSFEYIFAPDGKIWYAVTSYDTEEIDHEYYTEYVMKAFTITIYDGDFNEIGKVRDNIILEDDETRCVQAALGAQVTKQFFNNDANYEVMVSFFMNTPSYEVNSRTKAYSIKPLADGELSEAVAVVAGYPVDEIDCAKDKWSEDYYITFMTEETPSEDINYPTLIDYLADYRKVLTTYGKGMKPAMEKKIRQLDLPGDQMSSPMMLCKNRGGKLTLTYAQYEKTFFENPAGEAENENITADNNLIIEVYQMNDSYPAEMELVSTTRIPTIQNTDNPDVYCTYYGIGNLTWADDVDFDHYSSDGRPAFIVSTDDYLFSDDDHYNSGYFVYDADGKRIATIAENTYDYVMMSDVAGFEPQAMFVHMGEDMNFEFVDLYSCKTTTTIDHSYRGYSLSTSMDRVAYGDSYAYASALSYGVAIDDTHLAAPVCWIDSEGEFIRIDEVPTGEGVEMVQTYMNADGIKPYLFNTDSDIEYLMLVKRRIPGMDSLREELIIASAKKGVLHTFTEEEGKGALRTVLLMAGSDPKLLVVYMNDSYKFTTDAYTLPFEKTLAGSGSPDDPYLIATGGELQLIKNAPGAHYRMANDIDCTNLDYYPIEEFKGTLDGAGHTVSNLTLTTRDNGKTGLFLYAGEATIKDIDFYNARMYLSGSYEAGLIAATASNTKFDNIHIMRMTASGDSYEGEFGSIAGKSWLWTSFNGCELAGADIFLPSSTCLGGIVGDVRTGCSATGCHVSGRLTAANTLGGIVGSTTSGDETFTQNHVDADLKAEHTVGGIAGFLDRSKVRSNYVEGTIEATKPSKWNKALSLGGVAGELEGDWQGNGDVPVSNNLVAVSALIYPDLSEIVEDHPRQLSTVHRIVGRTSYNSYLEEEPEKIIYENGVVNNLVVSDLAVVDYDFDEKSVEGTTTDPNTIDQELLQAQLGFAYGSDASSPWNLQAWDAYDPSLFYESIAYIAAKEITADKGSTFQIEIDIISRLPLNEDEIQGSFICEFDESVIEQTGAMAYDGNRLMIEMRAISSGETDFTANILSGHAACKVKVVDGNGVESAVSSFGTLKLHEGILTAEGSRINVFSLSGNQVLAGRDRVDVSPLDSGVYIAVATDSNGKTRTLKFAK